MSGLRDAFDEIVADVPVYGDLDRAIEQVDREQRHRYGMVAGLAAAAAVIVVIVGGLAVTRDGNDSREPIGPTTPTVTQVGPTPVPGSAAYFAAPPDDAGDPVRGWFASIGGAADLYLFRQGESPRRINATEANELCPLLSPDGANLAFLSGPFDDSVDGSYAVGDLVVVALDGAGNPEPGSRRVLFRNTGPNCPQWSPDGRTLALTSEGDDWRTTELHLVTLDGKDRVLAVLQPYASQFAWSPDGDAVAYLTEDAVWIAPLPGGEPELFWRSTATPDTTFQGIPLAGSPTSLWWLSTGELAVVVLPEVVQNGAGYQPDGPFVLHVIDRESGRHERTDLDVEGGLGGPAGQGVWSPDGSRFAMGFEDSTGSGIMIYDRVSGSTITPALKLDNGDRFFINPGQRFWLNGVAWSADGERLLMDAQRGGDGAGGPFAYVSMAMDGSVEVLTPWTFVDPGQLAQPQQ